MFRDRLWGEEKEKETKLFLAKVDLSHDSILEVKVL